MIVDATSPRTSLTTRGTHNDHHSPHSQFHMPYHGNGMSHIRPRCGSPTRNIPNLVGCIALRILALPFTVQAAAPRGAVRVVTGSHCTAVLFSTSALLSSQHHQYPIIFRCEQRKERSHSATLTDADMYTSRTVSDCMTCVRVR